MRNNVINFLYDTVQKYPNKTCVSDDKEKLDFIHFFSRAVDLAMVLRSDNKTNQPVLVYLPKSVAAIVSFAGILLSGNFYAPIDLKSPENRKRAILDNLRPLKIISNREYSDDLKKLNVSPEKIVFLEDCVSNFDSITYEGWVKIRKPKASYGRTKTYSQLKIFLSNSHTEIKYSITADGAEIKSGIITPNTPFQTLKANFTSTPEEITITFKGNDSPDIYGISLEGNTGIVMDNIPLRGCSGTIFTKQDATLLSNMYASLSPSLIIMEFGGNTIPYIDSDKAASDYGNWFQSQIYFMKKLNPNAAIIVIGPGDMSIKDKTEYVTYPYLEKVRDALKKATLNTGCVFWDMYEVMGGKNSMPKWVTADPALAASDYTHFTPKGAKKVAEEFNSKLFDMYDEYKHPDKKKEEKPKDKAINDSIQ